MATVIVPVKDGTEALIKCVEALLEQDYPPERYEIIVVDNGSVVPPARVLPQDRRLRLLEEATPGSYAARNAALGHAHGEVLAFTDADCVPDTAWLRVGVEFLCAHPEVAMIGGQIEFAFRHGEPQTGAEWFEFVEGFPQEKYIGSGFAVTANMITRRAAFDRVGKFDGSLMSGGDADWGRRVRDAGGALWYLPECKVIHPARATWAELGSKAERTTTGIVRRTAKTARPRRRLARLLAGQLYRSAVLPITVLRSSKFPDSAARRKFMLTRWRVDLVIVAALSRGLVHPEGR